MRAGPDKFRARNDNLKPATLVARYAGALAPGSYLALSHITYEGLPPRLVQEGAAVYDQAQGVYPRSREQIERFFAGLEIVPPYPGASPAVTHIGLWGAEEPRPGRQRRFPLVVRRGRPPPMRPRGPLPDCPTMAPTQ